MRIICSTQMMENISQYTENDAAESLLALVRTKSPSSSVRNESDKNDENDSKKTKRSLSSCVGTNKKQKGEEIICKAMTTKKSNTRETCKTPKSHASKNDVANECHDDQEMDEGIAPQIAVPSRVNCASPLATSSIDSNGSSSVIDEHFNENDRVKNTFENLSNSSNKSDVPDILMKLLLDDSNQSTMCFLPDNQAFVISSSQKFSNSFMGRYFKLTKFGCFIAKLERWGFSHQTDSSNPDCHLFYHPEFVKDDWKSLLNIRYRPRRKKPDPNVANTFVNRTSSGSRSVQSLPFLTIRQTIDRHVELTTRMCESPINAKEQEEKNSRTQKIVDDAIACLLRDEDHTRDLIAREKTGQIPRRLPYFHMPGRILNPAPSRHQPHVYVPRRPNQDSSRPHLIEQDDDDQDEATQRPCKNYTTTCLSTSTRTNSNNPGNQHSHPRRNSF